MAHQDLKTTPHLTDAQFKASLDECNNYLSEHTSRLLAFLRQVDHDLVSLDPEDFNRTYVQEKTETLSWLLSNVADLGRTTLDRLVARSCLLTVREELASQTKKK